MIEELLFEWGTLSAPELHLVFLAIMGTAAALVMAGTAALVWRRQHGGPAVRGAALVSCALTALGMALAGDVIPLDHYGDMAADLRRFHCLLTASLAFTALTLAATSAAARTGLLAAACQGLASLGTLVFLTLLSAVPPGADPSWEIERFLEFGIFMTAGFILLLGVGFAGARRQSIPTAMLFAFSGALGLVTLIQGYAQHAGPGISVIIAPWLPVIGVGGWLAWLMRRRPGPGHRQRSPERWLRQIETRWLDHPLTTFAVLAAPVAVAGAALVLAGSGSAREASRVNLGGLNITPGLAVPFFFAVALGILVGREQWRWRGWGGIALTGAMALLLLAQKEVGNTAVVLMVAAVVFLIARGTLPHLLAGGGLAFGGILLAYQLAPVISAIPFTFRERIHLWLGGAELLQRGGHLVTASYVCFRVGGFWGIGLHQTPDLNLPRLVVALHTDFPLVMLGLYGGLLLLTIFVAFFVCFSLLLLHTLRCLSFDGDTRRARRQTPILAGLWAVPVISTTLNLTGAISQVSPFTGVPVAFVSYSSIFILFNFAIVALFVLAGNRDALRAHTRADALARQAAALDPNANPVSFDDPTDDALPETKPDWREATRAHAANLPERIASVAAWRLALRSLRRHMRLSSLDGGVVALMIILPLIGAAVAHRLHERYTDNARYFGHPRLDRSMRIELGQGDPDTDALGNQRWEVVEAPDQAALGPLEGGRELRLDSLLMVFRQGRLQVRGSCFSTDQLREGIWLGFEGMLDAPELPLAERLAEPALKRVGDTLKRHNDLVVPFGDITSHHLQVRLLDSGRYHLESLSDLAHFHALDADGRRIPGKVTVIDPGQGFAVGALKPRRFFIDPRPEAGEVCVAMRRGAIFEYPLSAQGPTVIGDMTLLRRQLAMRTTDLSFAAFVKEAAEAGILTRVPYGPLRVIPHAPEDRAAWDKATRQTFARVFNILKIKQEDGSTREVLAWARPFYADGGRRFDGEREMSAFAMTDTRVLGLVDTYRFSRVLPTLYDPYDPERNGLLFDRKGAPLARLDVDKKKVVGTLKGGGALIGVDLRERGVRDGLLRVFSSMMRGVEALPDVHDELEDKLAMRRRGPWGWDVTLTIDQTIQESAFEIVRDEIEKLDAREPRDIHHATAIVLGPRNEILALVQMPDTGPLETFEQVAALKKRQREAPLDSPALDALHRRTTLGSTVKLLTLIAAFKHKDDCLTQWKDGEWYINAEHDPPNADLGRFAERGGALKSWRGVPIAPVHNYGRSYFGKVVPVRTLLVKSLNTASAYTGLNLGRERFIAYYDQMGLSQTVDLLPAELDNDGPFGDLLDRHWKDSASALPVVIGSIPVGEPWTLSLTARLPLSGLSDYSIFSLAAGSSVIARGGLYHPPRLVRAVRSRRTGEEIRFAPARPTPIISPEDAESLESYMKDVILRGTGASYQRGVPKDVWTQTAGKTGTGETVRPVAPNGKYDLKNKPRTRDHKAFVAIWPTSSPEPYLVAVVFEHVSHLDGRVAVRTSQRIMESIRATHAIAPEPSADRAP